MVASFSGPLDRPDRGGGSHRNPAVLHQRDARSCCAKKLCASMALAGATRPATSDKASMTEAMTFIVFLRWLAVIRTTLGRPITAAENAPPLRFALCRR